MFLARELKQRESGVLNLRKSIQDMTPTGREIFPLGESFLSPFLWRERND